MENGSPKQEKSTTTKSNTPPPPPRKPKIVKHVQQADLEYLKEKGKHLFD